MSAFVSAVPIPALVPSRTRLARSGGLAVAIPGDSVIETTLTGGLFNFFNVYQNLLVARILLSWFPAAAQSPLARPLLTICDPFLGVFRQTIPPIFGLDLSPIIAIFLLQSLGGASQALGAEMDDGTGAPRPKKTQRKQLRWGFGKR